VKGKLMLHQTYTYVYNSCNSHRSDGGTGFVGNIVINNAEEYFIITCHHVIPNETAAKEGLFMFNHMDDQYVPGKISGKDLFDMKCSKWFWTNEVRESI